MADESQQPCVMCHQPNQQMLMLSCVHDPCVNCAAIHYCENQPHNSPIYTCAKCGQETELDESSIGELRRIYSLHKNKKRSRNPPSTALQKDKYQKKDYNDSYNQREIYYPKTRANQPASTVSRRKQVQQTPSSKYYTSNPVSQPSYASNAKHSSYQPMYPCSDHQEEQLTYFCFTCHRPICPECAIHGSHKEHEVQTTRKAIKHIRQLLVEDKQKIDLQLNSLSSNRDSAKKLSKQWVEENKRDKDYIKKKIAQLRSVISQKQRELLRSTQVNLQRNTQILRNEATASDSALQNLLGVNRAIESTLKKDELTILHQFNKRDDQTNQALQVADKQKDKLRQQQIKNPLKALQLDLFEQDLDRIISELQNLKLSAAPLKS